MQFLCQIKFYYSLQASILGEEVVWTLSSIFTLTIEAP